jgi:hypothetical protein
LKQTLLKAREEAVTSQAEKEKVSIYSMRRLAGMTIAMQLQMHPSQT